MKKIFSLGWMLVAALTLTYCSKDAVEENVMPEGAGAFELVADLEGGRTTANGIETAWAGGDAINVWTNVTNQTTYTSHGSFAIAQEDLATSTFRGTLVAELTDASYDWYAFYPYSQYNGYSSSSPAKTAYNKIADKAQLQKGNNNQAHIAGANAPLYGVALDVAAGEKPALQFKHLSTLVKVVVTNATEEAISIKSVKFETETEKISGTFYTTLTDEPTYESSDESYTYNYVDLTVQNGENIAIGSTADFYLNITPLKPEVDETVTVTVTNNNDEVVTKTYTIPAGTSLSKPGKITTLNFAFEAPEAIEKIPDGNYVIVAEYEGGYYAMSSADDGARRAHVVLSDFATFMSSEGYPTDNEKIQWQIAQVEGGYTISQEGKYLSWGGENNDAPMATEATAVSVIKQNDGTYQINTDSGNRILAKNTSDVAVYGFAFYKSTGTGVKNLYLKPVVDDTRTALATPSVTATVDETSILVTWSEIANAGSYEVTCGNEKPVVISDALTYTFADLAHETTYEISVVAIPNDWATYKKSEAGKASATTVDAPVGEGGGRDDFNTVAKNTSYSARQSTAGWIGENCAVYTGGSTDNNGVFKSLLGAFSDVVGWTMNGKTSAVGIITSPTIANGCGTLSFDYGFCNNESNGFCFKVEILQNGTAVQTYTVENSDSTKFEKHSWSQEINVAGSFVIKFTNNCPSNNSSSNKDRTTIFNVVWTGYSE